MMYVTSVLPNSEILLFSVGVVVDNLLQSNASKIPFFHFNARTKQESCVNAFTTAKSPGGGKSDDTASSAAMKLC
jgi:hypothetical protein